MLLAAHLTKLQQTTHQDVQEQKATYRSLLSYRAYFSMPMPYRFTYALTNFFFNIYWEINTYQVSGTHNIMENKTRHLLVKLVSWNGEKSSKRICKQTNSTISESSKHVKTITRGVTFLPGEEVWLTLSLGPFPAWRCGLLPQRALHCPLLARIGAQARLSCGVSWVSQVSFCLASLCHLCKRQS